MPNTDPIKRKAQNRKDQAAFRVNHPNACKMYRQSLKVEMMMLREAIEKLSKQLGVLDENTK